MSGCCGQGPVITSALAVPRVDVEPVLLCDVLPDGTVAATVLVEPVYDATTSERVGTRVVDPVTGVDYTPAGELQPCPTPESCSCEAVLLCDTVPVTTSAVTLTGTGYQVRNDQVISGAPRRGTDADATAIWSGQTVSVPGAAPDGSAAGAHTHYGVILGVGDVQCGDLDPAGTLDVTATVTYRNDGPGGAWDYYGRLSLWDGSTMVTADPFGAGSGVFFPAGDTRTATITGPVPVASLLAGDVTVEFNLETGADPLNGTPAGDQPKTWTVSGGTLTAGPAPVTGCASAATPFLRHLCRSCTGGATVTDTTLDGTTTYAVQGEVGVCGPSGEETAAPLVLGQVCYDDGTGTVRAAAVVRCAGCEDQAVQYVDVETGEEVTAPTLVDCPPAAGCDQFTGTLCYQEPATQDPSFTLHKFNNADPNHPGCLVGLDAMDGDFPFIQYNDPITAWEGTYSSNTGTASNVEISAPELGGFIDWSTFSPPIPSVPNAGIPAPYTGTAVFNGVTVTLEVFTEQALTTGTQYLRMGGTLHFRLSFSSPVTMLFGTQGFADPAPDNGERFCNVTATGVVTGAGEIRTAYGLRDCETGETTWRDQVSGQDVDLTQAVVVPCPQAQRDCASPTEPTATVGLCLADGTPIAVTVVRDCAGIVTSEGWLNLTTGAYSAGAPPAGTVACGDSRSVQVSGTFCDVLADGTVAGLVLVEYSYDDTGAISSVRLVDAVTGTTYTPQGTVTTCPAGVEQPQQDAVILCHTAADGTVTEFLRDYRRDELGAVVGHSDYLLDGTAYTPDLAGTVGVCPPQGCQNCETLVLCADDSATITGQGVSSGTLSNGVTWQVKGNASATPSNLSNADGAWWGNTAIFPNANIPAYTFTFTRPAVVEFSVYMGYFSPTPEPDDNCMQLPAGLEVVSLPAGFVYNPVTGLVCVNVTQAADPTGANMANPTRAVSARFRTPGPVSTLTTRFLGPRRAISGAFRTAWVGALQVTASVQFLRRICRDCEGLVTGITDTLLDGTTAYVPPAVVGVCEPSQEQPQGADAEPLLLCHTATADGTVTPFLRHLVYNASTGVMTARTDTLLDGTTLFAPGAGTVGICTEPQPCDVSPVCFQPNGRVEFISNQGTPGTPGSTANTVDADWKWQTDPNAPAASWWDMYRIAKNGAWTNDPSSAATGYEGTAHWVGAHCNGFVQTRCNPVGANEGPGFLTVQPGLSAANPFNWYASATFDLPADADPASIQIEVPALAADQLLVAWRLNTGPWQPVGTDYQTLYTLPASTVPGAQAGTNRITLHIQETSPSDSSEGLLAHVVATYAVESLVQWTRILCPDGTTTYLDEFGDEQTAVPAGWVQVPCPSGEAAGVDVETWPLCVLDNTTGNVLQAVRAEQVYDATGAATGAPRIVDAVTGGPVAIPGGAHLGVCPDGDAPADVELVVLCDVTEVTTPEETPERITNGHFATDASGWALTGGARYVPSSSPDGSVGFLDLSADNGAAGTAEQTTTVTPGLTYNLSARIGIWSTGGNTPQQVRVDVLDGSGAVLHTETVTPAAVSGGPLWPADGVVGPVPIVATDTTMTVRFTDLVGGDFIDALLDDVSLLGPGVPAVTTEEVVPFLRRYTFDADGTATHTDTTLDGDTYLPSGEVTACTGNSTGGGDGTGEDVETVLLCDVTEGEAQSYTPTSTAVLPPVASTEPAISSTTAGYMVDPTPAFSSGGSVMVPTWGTDPGGSRINAISGRVTSSGPTPCGTPGDVRVTVSLRATNTGAATDVGSPEAGLTIRNGTTVLDTANVANTNTGAAQTFEVEAVVPWADLIAGNITWYWWARVYQGPNIHKTFTVDQYAVTVEDAEPIAGCGEGAVTSFLRHFTPDPAAGTAPYFDTTVDGAAYEPTGTVTSCAAAAASTPAPPDPADQPVQTGIRRVTGTVVQALVTEFPGLQSVSLAVLADTVHVTMGNGAAQPVPAGATLTWSTNDTDDSSLSVATFAGATAAASYLLNWTWKATVAG
jgi:hypothetical protein